ncbi:MAG: TPM domain-containing protein [Deltaproteobacteria bacterium]|nr:TPM domain-containing protein [Deltaproteobacteria bacterium]
MKQIILLITLLLFPLQLLALEAPALTGRVNDLAKMLSPETSQRLEQKLAAFERETSNQVAVLTVPSLQGDDIDQFSIRVAESWRLGQTGRDNGVLLILAQAERKVRIEVGMGLQGVLPDITAGRIIRETMRPYLKSGNFDQGISVGVDAIIAATKGEFKGDVQASGKKSSKKSPSMITIFLVVAVVAAVLGLFSRYLGGAAGAVGLPLAAATAFPGLGLLTLILLGAAGLVGGFLLARLVSGLRGGGGGGGGGFYGGGWGGGGFYGGGFSGGSFGGGGDDFSGGGGGFDGGGSSDDF